MATLSAASASASDDGAAAIQRYGAFVEDVLKPQLQASLAQRDALSQEIREYEQLQQFVNEQLTTNAAAAAGDTPTPLHTLMDLGQRFHVRAKIPDTSMITVDIGLNFHAEMTLAEAQAFVAKHLVYLDEKRQTWQLKAREISTHINVVLDAITKLAALQNPAALR